MPEQAANAFLSASCFVPVYETKGGFSPQIFPTSDGDLLLCFSSSLALAQFCGSGQSYLEMEPLEICRLAKELRALIGHDFSKDYAEIFSSAKIDVFEKYLETQAQTQSLEHLDCYTPQNVDDLVENLEAALLGFKQKVPLYLVEIKESELALVLIHQDGFNPAPLFEAVWPVMLSSEYENVSFLPLRLDRTSHQKFWENVQKTGRGITPKLPKSANKPPILR